MDLWNVKQPFISVDHLIGSAALPFTKTSAVLDLYMARNRLYHGIYHIAFMWDLHRKLSTAFSSYEYLERAFSYIDAARSILYHDAVYNATSKTNEHDSAEMWLRDVRHEEPDWVHGTIMATADHLADRPVESNEDKLREWVVGLDLAGLAAPWETFALNNRLIRLEYSHVSDAEWDNGRSGFMRALSGKKIFKDTILYDLLEKSAHDNIERLLAEGV